MKFVFRYCITSLLFLAPLTATAQVDLIVRLAPDAPADLVAALDGSAAKQQPFAPLFEDVARIQPVFTRTAASKRDLIPAAFTLTLPDSARYRRLFDRWQTQPGVAYVQPNYTYRLDLPAAGTPDPLIDSLAHLEVINVFEAWDVTTGEASVRVGLVDTGVYLEHPDLASQFWINPGEDLNGNGTVEAADFNGVDDDGNGYVDDIRGFDFVDRTEAVEPGDLKGRDPDPSEDQVPGGGRGHGTIVAGVLAAALDNGIGISGVAPGVRMVPLRAFGADGNAEDDDVAAAIVYGALMGLEVINLSFGDVYFSPLMQESIRFAQSQGTLVVASAGNVGGDDPHFPSDYPEVLSVAWLNAEGTAIAGRGTFGVGVDLGAPGSSIYTTLLPDAEALVDLETEDLYGRRSGSSMAAPMVSATAALLRSHDPSLSPAALRSILTASAVDIGTPGWDHETGAGRLDAGAALRRALPARAELLQPAQDSGISGDGIAIIGTALDPAFVSFELAFAPGFEEPEGAWTRIAGPLDRQVFRDTLALWSVGGLAEGGYILRLQVNLSTGRTVEDRRRVYLDRTPPELAVFLLDDGLVGGAHGLVADLATDDLTHARMEVNLDGQTFVVESDRLARRHGLAWAEETHRGGEAHVRLTVTNSAGLASVQEATIRVPANRVHTALFEATPLSVPAGFLLPWATDYDRDGLLEIVLNQYRQGWIGDTLGFYEWAGTDFKPAAGLIANVIPRDVGDSDSDGFLELLTQVGGATLLLEQPTPEAYPIREAYLDTTGLSAPTDSNAAFGARLTDLDADGRGELLVHNTSMWRVLEYDGGTYREVTRLGNPTSTGEAEVSDNAFQEPEALIQDFDQDGRLDVLTGDGDGDWIMYESTGDNALGVAWTYETRRYNAGSRMAAGDFDGDGAPEFLTYTQSWLQTTRDNEREPPYGIYYLWDRDGDDAYTLQDSLPVAGFISRHGTAAAADFDGDGQDEIIVIDPPDLYILAYEAGEGFVLQYHHSAEAHAYDLRSIAVTTGDFDEDGRAELVAVGAADHLIRFAYRPTAAVRRPPQWQAAYALGADQVVLRWTAAGADSISVFQARGDTAFDLLATTTVDSLLIATGETARYALRAWYDGEASPLSLERRVRPHAPAVVQAVLYPDVQTLELLFSEPIREGLRAEQFRLEGGPSPVGFLMSREGRGVILRFKDVAAGTYTLRWQGVVDVDGTPAGQHAVSVAFPEQAASVLFLARWEIRNAQTVALTFNLPLDPATAVVPGNYQVSPFGQVADVRFDPDTPDQVVLRLEGRAIGATGLSSTLRLVGLRAANGAELAQEGNAVALVKAAADLSAVLVFPNPYRSAQHDGRVIVAGLPAEASLQVLSATGIVVKALSEEDGDGGVAWDLTDTAGEQVPSGVYLIRVEAPGERPVIKKVAVIR